MKKILSKLTSLKENTKKDKVIYKPITWFKTDKDFKNMYTQNANKVNRILENIEQNGFDKSQNLIALADGSLIDGNSRLLAIQQFNKLHPENKIETVPVVIKEFKDKEDALKYEVHLNTDRRSITDGDLFTSFSTLNGFKEKLKSAGKNTEEYSDKNLAEMLNVSERQISKLRYIYKYATAKLKEQIINNECSINVAEQEIKKLITPQNQNAKTSKKEKKSKIDIEAFRLGMQFALNEYSKGKSANDIWNDEHIFNESNEISFTEEELDKLKSSLNDN